MVEADRRLLFSRHVSKAVLLEAVAQFAPKYVNRLAKLKKADIASEAERLVESTGWMPALFETGHDTEPQEGAQGTVNEVDAPEDATEEEAAHALAA